MRVDAVRNREAVLAAAGRLFDAAEDPDRVSINDIAAAAGVGKGTLFRGFGDRAGLISALWHQRSGELLALLEAADDELDTPRDRVLALLEAVWRFKMRNRVLALTLENAGQGNPYGTADYENWHRALTRSITAVRGPADAEYLAHALLASVRTDLLAHLSDRPERELRSGLTALVDAILR